MTLLYFSPVVWDSYEQRPHYFARDFLATGGTSVIWINPYAARLPSVRDLSRADLRDAPLTLARPEGLTVLDAGGLPVDPLPGGTRLNTRLFWTQLLKQLEQEAARDRAILGIGRPTALALTALTRLNVSASFYDAMDDFPEFYRGRSREATRRVEREIAARVGRIVVSSTHLQAKFAGAGPEVTLLRNAYDMSLLPPIGAPRPSVPRLGFVGCLGGWFDWPIVLRLAEAVPHLAIDLVGPRAARVPSRLPDNIHLHPPCSQAEGVRWLQTFSAGLIPFTRDALTAGVDPIKYYQYRGAGLATLSTRFGDMTARGVADGTFFMDDSGGMRAAVEAALAYRPGEADMRRFREHNTWAARFRAAQLWPPA